MQGIRGNIQPRNHRKMAEDILAKVLQPAVQAFLPAGRTESRKRVPLTSRRLEDAIRRQSGPLPVGTGRLSRHPLKGLYKFSEQERHPVGSRIGRSHHIVTVVLIVFGVVIMRLVSDYGHSEYRH